MQKKIEEYSHQKTLDGSNGKIEKQHSILAGGEPMHWDEEQLRLAILSTLLEARDSGRQGATYKLLKNKLSANNEHAMTAALDWLKYNDYIFTGRKSAVITNFGEDYLRAMRPYLCSPKRGGGPDGNDQQPGWWPPPDDPDNPSGVPRRPAPVTGTGEITLPLP